MLFSSISVHGVGLIVEVDVGAEVKVEWVELMLDDARIEGKDLRHVWVEVEADLELAVRSLLVSRHSFDGQVVFIAVSPAL